MTRYSALLWSRDVKCLPNPGRRISVESNREVWWEECVYTRQYKGYQDTLVHIINAPDTEAVDFKVSRDPAPAKLVEVGYEALGKAKRVKAWLIQPYGYESREKEPVLVTLRTRVDEKKVYVELPPVVYYALVVFREAVK